MNWSRIAWSILGLAGMISGIYMIVRTIRTALKGKVIK